MERDGQGFTPRTSQREEYFGSAEWTQMKVISWHFLFSWMVHFISLQTEISVSVAAFVTRDDMWTSNTLKSLSAEVNSFDYRQLQNPNSINICSGSFRTTANQSGLTATHSTQNDPLPVLIVPTQPNLVSVVSNTIVRSHKLSHKFEKLKFWFSWSSRSHDSLSDATN